MYNSELVPKIVGADVEVANFLSGTDDISRTGSVASRLLLREIVGMPGSGCGYGYGHDPQDWGRKFLWANGGCFYIDLSHLEFCNPEVRSAFDFVAVYHAMLQIAREAQWKVNEKLTSPSKVSVLVNNSDGQGNSYGGHLNFLVSRKTWDDIFYRKPHFMAYLASYQATSIIFTGQGKVGSENEVPWVDYQISQRIDFIESFSGEQTTYRRPIINGRDEALCGSDKEDTESPAGRLARLHCIFYDSNLCHVAILLKVGIMQIFLAMLEAGQLNPNLILDDPLDALRAFSDPSLESKARTSGGKTLTAVEWQLRFLEQVERFVSQGRCRGIVPRAEDILAVYADTLEKLRRKEFEALASRLDWVLKLHLLRQAQATRPHLTGSSPEMKHLDHLYSSLDSAEGLYWACERAGAVETVVSPAEIERFLNEPPADTRAYTRAMLLRKVGPDQIKRIDWDSITFELPGQYGWPVWRKVALPDPCGLAKGQTAQLFGSEEELGSVLDRVDAITAKPADAALPAPRSAANGNGHGLQRKRG